MSIPVSLRYLGRGAGWRARIAIPMRLVRRSRRGRSITVGLTLQAKQDGNRRHRGVGQRRSHAVWARRHHRHRSAPRRAHRSQAQRHELRAELSRDRRLRSARLSLAADAGASEREQQLSALAGARRARSRRVEPPAVKPGRPLPSVKLTAEQVADRIARSLRVVAVGACTGGLGTRRQRRPRRSRRRAEAVPERNISRLVCPRRLEPRKNYVACVVPATDGGRLRGLGRRVQSATLTAHGTALQPADIELPVYYSLGILDRAGRRHRNSGAALETAGAVRGRQGLIGTAAAYRRAASHRRWRSPSVRRRDAGPHDLRRRDGVARLQARRAEQHLLAKSSKRFSNSGQALATQGTPKADTVPTLSPPIYGEHPGEAPHRQRARKSAAIGSMA